MDKETSELTLPQVSRPERRRRVLLLSSHVIQYSSPIFRRMAQDPRLELLVVYCSLQGAESSVDPEFGREVSWDTPVLEGYPWVNPPNRAPVPGLGRFFGLFNPGLWAVIREGHFDAVILTGYFYLSAWVAIAAARSQGVPVIFATDAHDVRSYTWATPRKWKNRLKKIVVRRIYSLSRAVLCGSSGTVEYMLSLGVPKEQAVLSGNVIDNEWWAERAAAADRDAIRSSWGVPRDALVILFCGKLQTWKLPLDLLEAFGRANLADSYLVFAGDGPLRPRIEERAQSIHISERIRFLGFVGQMQMPSVYRASDLLVLPSAHESFGYVVVEAMASGLPVAVSDRVGARFDLVSSRETGFVFAVGDIDGLTKIITEVHSDPEGRMKLAAAARRRLETWSPCQYVDGVVRAIDIANGKASEGRSTGPRE